MMTEELVAAAGRRAATLARETYEARRGHLGDERALIERYHAVVSVAVAWACPPVANTAAYGALMALVSHATEHMDGRERADWSPIFDGRETATFHAEHFDIEATARHGERLADVLRVIAASGVEFSDDGRAIREMTAYVETATSFRPTERKPDVVTAGADDADPRVRRPGSIVDSATGHGQRGGGDAAR